MRYRTALMVVAATSLQLAIPLLLFRSVCYSFPFHRSVSGTTHRLHSVSSSIVKLSTSSNDGDVTTNILSSLPTSSLSNEQIQQVAVEARRVRALHGHEQALPMYQKLLEINPFDRTAGSRIAASVAAPNRHDLACLTQHNDEDNEDLSIFQELNSILTRHNYTHNAVCELFGVESSSLLPCEGPLFVKPARPFSVSADSARYPLSDTNHSGMECLVALFLLSLAVPTKYLMQSLGERAVELMIQVVWIFPCEIDPTLSVPYVHVFPLSFSNSSNKTIWITTDLHPNVISMTSVGGQYNNGLDGGDDTVMYIGPDSLALAQHFDPWDLLIGSSTLSSTPILHGLDLCTGSGIQALVALGKWEIAMEALGICSWKGTSSSTRHNQLHMTVVDINPRALRFALFNAYLNGYNEYADAIHADLVSNKILSSHENNKASCATTNLDDRLGQHNYHVVFANPPFIPVPKSSINNNEYVHQGADNFGTQSDTIDDRYGYFSSGGSTGEVVLQRVVEIASQYLRSDGGVVGIVSEFFHTSHDPTFDRIVKWWNNHTDPKMPTIVENCEDCCSHGILFLNEFPISAETYASRRADNVEEAMEWIEHLTSLNITSCSPGLLLLKKAKESDNGRRLDVQVGGVTEGWNHSGMKRLQTISVPRSEKGSIWTPSNRFVNTFIRNITETIFC